MQSSRSQDSLELNNISHYKLLTQKSKQYLKEHIFIFCIWPFNFAGPDFTNKSFTNIYMHTKTLNYMELIKIRTNKVAQ